MVFGEVKEVFFELVLVPAMVLAAQWACVILSVEVMEAEVEAFLESFLEAEAVALLCALARTEE